MIEVFIAFTMESDIGELDRTLEAWDLDGMEPVAIRVQPRKFELHRRVTAESVSVGDYIVAGLGSAPAEDNFGELAEQALDDHPNAGLIIPACASADWKSGRVAICRKGAVKHWILPQGSQEADILYAQAHREAVRHAGFEVIDCPTIHYRLLVESLPS